MKLIENSIGIENLQSLVSYGELEAQMASCGIVHVNGQKPDKENFSENESIKRTKFNNGVKGNMTSPVKKSSNGFLNYEISDDDYQLVLESSSDEGNSPSKKADEELISAPQIVQEIEDLLGIDSKSVRIDDELKVSETENIEITGKEDNNIVNGTSSNKVPQEIEDVFDEKDEAISNTEDESKVDEHKEDNKDETRDCNSSSIMNVVFDEVEIGTDSIEEQAETHTSLQTTIHTENTSSSETIGSTNEINVTNLKGNDTGNVQLQNVQVESCNHEVTVNDNREEDNINNTIKDTKSCSAGDEVPNEIPLTQLSDSSIEWTVIDSIEESEDEISPMLSVDYDTVNKLDIKNDTTCEELTFEIIEKKNTTKSATQPEEDESRKRTASINNEENLCKKPKLEGEENDTSLPNLKRPCSEAEHEAKRTKLCDNVPDFVKPTTGENASFERKCESKELEDNNLTVVNSTSNKLGVITLPTEDEQLSNCNVNKDICDKKEEHTLEESSLFEKDEDNNIKNIKVNSDIKDLIVDVELKSSESVISEIALSDGGIVLNSSENKSATTVIPEANVTVTDVESKSFEKNDSSRLISEKTSVYDIQSKLSKVGSLMECHADTSENSSKVTFPKSTTSLNETASGKEESSESLKEKLKTPIDLKENCIEPTVSLYNKLNDSKDCKAVFRKLNQNNEEGNSITSLNFVCETTSTHENESNACESFFTSKKEKKDKEDNIVEDKSNSASFGSANNREIPLKNKQAHIDEQILKKDMTNSIEQILKKDVNNSNVNCNITESSKPHLNSKDVHSKKSPFNLLTKHFQNKIPESKQHLSNIDKAIESVVEKAKSDFDRAVPLLKKFHKDQLKKLTRLDLEETVVMKICEAITDRSEIGQMRLKCKTLEQNCELWRKKTMQLEKQNRELEMVLKRYLSETAQIKKDNQNKLTLPIRVTRSVGLQVVLESTMHGALVASKNKVNNDTERQKQLSQQQQLAQQQLQQLQSSKAKRIEKETVHDKVRAPSFNPVPNNRSRGRSGKTVSNSNPSPSSVSSVSQPSKTTPPHTPVKPQVLNRKIGTPSKDLEVIDLTDKEDKTKTLLQSSGGPSIRIAPSTQVCFMQNSPSPSTSQTPMAAYIVQKPGQRQQYLVATSSPSPTRPSGTSSRPPPALAVPVFRSGGQIIPVQSNSQGGARTTPSNAPNTTRQVPSAIRLSSSPILKHPAPLPPPPAVVFTPGFKSPPPKPQLKIAKTVNGIMLSWSMTLTKDLAEMASYQLYAYQEGSQQPSSSLWKKVGDVKALPLPMACTLTQFMEGNKYHFAVRAVDIHGRVGPFSSPGSILLTK